MSDPFLGGRSIEPVTEVSPIGSEGRQELGVAEPSRSDARYHLSRGGLALIINSGLSAALGIIYWIAAAHLFNQTSVGHGAALVSALMSVSGIAQLNFARSLSWLLPRARDRATTLLARVYVLTGGVSLFLGVGFVIVAPIVNSKFNYIPATPPFAAAFAVCVALYSIFSLEDAVLATTRRAWVIPIENASFGISKLPLLFAATLLGIGANGLGLFLAWVIPLIAIIVPVNAYIFSRVMPHFMQSLRRAQIETSHQYLRAASLVRLDFTGTMLLLLGTMPLSVLVLGFLGPEPAAAFYVAMTIASAVDLLSMNLGNVLTAEMSRVQGQLTHVLHGYMMTVWTVLASLGLGFAIGAPYILQVFGSHYRSLGTSVLQLMMLAVPARAALLLSIAVARARSRGRLIVLLQTIASVGTLVGAIALMPRLGLEGIGAAWLAANCLAGGIGGAATLMRTRTKDLSIA